MLLDDQLMKVQAMNASPFVKPFRAETVEWEATLQFLQVSVMLSLWLVPASQYASSAS
jgi:dynein heavy chain